MPKQIARRHTHGFAFQLMSQGRTIPPHRSEHELHLLTEHPIIQPLAPLDRTFTNSLFQGAIEYRRRAARRAERRQAEALIEENTDLMPGIAQLISSYL